MEKQRALEAEFAELDKLDNLDDNAALRYDELKEAIKAMESQICLAAKAIDADQTPACLDMTTRFAEAINAAAERGTPVEEIIFGKESILDLDTASCGFKIVREDGKLIVVGGELTAQCKAYPWLMIKVSGDEVSGEPVWYESGRIDRPNLSSGIGLGFHLDGSYQRGVLAFFRREYVRQHEDR